MKKLLIVLLSILFLVGCGEVSSEAGADGSDGSNGLIGSDGRNPITVCFREYTRDVPSKAIIFQDITGTSIQLDTIYYGEDNLGPGYYSGLKIRVPAGNIGTELKAMINGVYEIKTITNNAAHVIYFYTGNEADTATEIYMNCPRINTEEYNNYFSWGINTVEQESYFSDTFKE